MSIRHAEGSDTHFFCQKLTTANVSVPTELVAAAAAGRAETEKAASDGESFGSGFDFHDDISFSGGGDMGGVENEAVE